MYPRVRGIWSRATKGHAHLRRWPARPDPARARHSWAARAVWNATLRHVPFRIRRKGEPSRLKKTTRFIPHERPDWILAVAQLHLFFWCCFFCLFLFYLSSRPVRLCEDFYLNGFRRRHSLVSRSHRNTRHFGLLFIIKRRGIIRRRSCRLILLPWLSAGDGRVVPTVGDQLVRRRFAGFGFTRHHTVGHFSRRPLPHHIRRERHGAARAAHREEAADGMSEKTANLC